MSSTDSFWLAVLVAFGILFVFQTFSFSNNGILVANLLLTNFFMFQTLSSNVLVFEANFLTGFL